MTTARLPFRRRWPAIALVDGILLVFLGAISWLIAGRYVSADLIIWGDHAGQFMRFWYPLAHSLPELRPVIDWNPVWYAGYPELQFYPPGSVLLGLALNFLTLGQLSPQRIYNLLPALAFVLPMFTCFAFLRVALAPAGRMACRVAGVSAGLVTVAFTPMWGGIDAVVIGMIGERLAFAVTPLVLLVGWRLVERPHYSRLVIAAVFLAGLMLLHPFHAPGPVLAVSVYALVYHRLHRTESAPGTVKLLVWLGAWVILALGLLAWWLAPLLRYYTPYAAALVRATPDQVVSWFDAGPAPNLWLAAAPALLLYLSPHPRVRATVTALLAVLALLAIGILLNARVLVERLGFTSLDPVRFFAQYYLATILLVGCGIGVAAARIAWRMPALGVAAVGLIAVGLGPWLPTAWHEVRSHAQVPAHFRLAGLRTQPTFAGFWEALAEDPTEGRIFFLFHYLHVPVPDESTVPTTVASMTPYLTGREIIGGTFSHWSPVARWLWVGDPWLRTLPAQVEQVDNWRLFGVGWEQIDGADLAARLRRLNVTTVVAGPEDINARNVLDGSPHFRRAWDNGFFTLYHLAENSSRWIEAQGADVQLVERGDRRWAIQVDTADPEARLLLKMGHYPLWHATVNGQTVPLAANAYGLQEVSLPDGAPYILEVTYRAGWIEWGGAAVTFLSLTASAILLWRKRIFGVQP